MELKLGRGATQLGLAKLEAALEDEDSTAILLSLAADNEDDDAAVDDESAVKRITLARHAVERSRVPVIAVADGPLGGASAPLFLAASRRVCTSETVYSLREWSQRGLVPGLGALDTLAALAQPHIALAVALGALELRACDCMALSLATHYAPREALSAMVDELRAAPSQYYDVPLSRRTTSTPPAHLVPLYAAEAAAPLNEALRVVFGEDGADAGADGATDVTKVLWRLEERRRTAAAHAVALANEPCGIHIRTRERAGAVVSALDAASAALNATSPAVLAAILAELRAVRARRGAEPAAGAA